ncbi:MAG: Fe2+-dependent dioxygenase [Proteobacteria bacterium]|nr:Fe2+-dependent dioxygenase [Pseudomonadota bacterium]MBI3496570.1 Fe2+-dependent dioxygenase [Pseudomonadota bacterium]
MLIVPDLLTADELGRVMARIAAAPFADGRASAAGAAKLAKNNLEFFSDVADDGPAQVVDQAIRRNPMVQNYVYPRKLHRIIFNRYDIGMAYGDHLDSPLLDLGNNERLRADLSMTLFLSDPGSYDGGALAIDHEHGTARLKLPAGHAVFYRSVQVHRVETVTRGTRLAAVTWIESHVREAADREILYDLARLLNDVRELGQPGRSRQTMLGVYARLLQRWADN